MATKAYLFRNVNTGLEFVCFEGDLVHERITGQDSADYELVANVDPKTGEPLKGKAGKVEVAPVVAEPVEADEPVEPTEAESESE